MVGSGSNLSDYLQLFPLFTFVDPALDEDNKIDESDNDEISAKPEALNTLCGLVCVPQGAPHLLEVPFGLVHDLLAPDLEVRNPNVKYVHCKKKADISREKRVEFQIVMEDNCDNYLWLSNWRHSQDSGPLSRSKISPDLGNLC